jgi:hypothetical protein
VTDDAEDYTVIARGVSEAGHRALAIQIIGETKFCFEWAVGFFFRSDWEWL